MLNGLHDRHGPAGTLKCKRYKHTLTLTRWLTKVSPSSAASPCSTPAIRSSRANSVVSARRDVLRVSQRNCRRLAGHAIWVTHTRTQTTRHTTSPPQTRSLTIHTHTHTRITILIGRQTIRKHKREISSLAGTRLARLARRALVGSGLIFCDVCLSATTRRPATTTPTTEGTPTTRVPLPIWTSTESHATTAHECNTALINFH
jgi:hypothetical protein